MARNLFGGTTSDVAEDIDGGRIPGAVGTVWDGPSDASEQLTDLTDADGAPIIQIVADNRGVVTPFYGPDNDAERLWVDFGVGKIAMVSSTVGDRLRAHTIAPDPHQSRSYTDEWFEQALPRAGGVVNSPEDANWLGVEIPLADPDGNVFVLSNENGTFTRITNRGAVFVDTTDQSTPLAIGAPGYPSTQAVINVSNSKATGSVAQSVFRVMGDGSVHSSGTINADNVGGNRVFSGPNPPAAPRAGDVWVQYA